MIKYNSWKYFPSQILIHNLNNIIWMISIMICANLCKPLASDLG